MSLPGGKQQTQSVKSSGKSPGIVRKDTPFDLVKEEVKIARDNLAEVKIPEVVKNEGSESATSSPIKIERKLPAKFSAVYDTPKTKSTQSPGQQKLDEQQKANVAVPRQRVPVPAPTQNVRPLVLATHLVPSLPVGLFELLAEAVEASTQLPVSLLYESRADRSVAKDVADFAILPAYSNWEDGDFFPVTFVFAHRLNDHYSGNVYVDIIVAADRAEYVKDIMDLRGHRCALPDRRQRKGAASLLLGDLKVKGESPAFFGNVLDSGSQVAALQMVAGKQAEIGVVEAPVLACHRRKMPGVSSLHTLGSLGPLPPYTIYVRKSVSAGLREKISSYLLSLNKDDEWLDRFSQYGVIGFTKNSLDAYVIDEDEKEVATSVRYY